MPEDFEPTDLIDSGDFTLQARGAVVGGVQASETFKATSQGQRPLGKGGETMGIAKRDLDAFQKQVWDESDRVRVQVIARLKEIQTEISDQLAKVDPTTQQGKDYQARIDNIQRKLNDPNFSISGYQLMLPDHSPDPTLEKAVALEQTAVKLANTAASVQPLFPGKLHVDSSRPRDIDPQNDLHLLSRAVASSKVDQLLGTNVLAEEKFGVDSNNNTVGISVGVDGFGVIGDLDNGKSYFMDIDYSSHNVQKGLYDLEALDYITGQIDRHPGNIFIDPTTGQVKGIDNDLAFPGLDRGQMLSSDVMGEAASKPVQNLPLFMHKDTAKKIESLNPDKLRQELSSVKYPGGGGKLSDAEIDGAVQRLKEMQTHIGELRKQGRVVDQFDNTTYQTAVKHQNDAIKAQFKDEWAKPYRKNTEQPDYTDLGDVRKTSYLGSVEVERQKNAMGLAQNQAEKLKPDELRTSTGYSGKMSRSPEHEKYAEKVDKALAQKKGEARHNMTKAELKELRELQKDIDHYESRLDKLDHHKVMASIKSLRYGGVDNAKEAFQEKRLEAMQKLKEIDDRLNDQAKQMLEGEKRDLMKSARKEVDQDKLLNQSQGVDMGHSQSLSQSVGQDSDKDKLGVEDGDNALSELEESDIEVEAPRTKVGVDDGQKVGQQQSQTQKQPEPKGMEVGGVKKITARFEVGNVTNTSTDTTQPSLQRKDSVREALKESSIVKLTRKNFEVDGGSNKVRQTSHIREDGGDGQTQESQKQKTGVSKGVK